MIDDEKILELFFQRDQQAIRELDIKYGKICHSFSYNIVNRNARKGRSILPLKMRNMLLPCSAVSPILIRTHIRNPAKCLLYTGWIVSRIFV